jgi:hypothetical protein
VLAQQQQRESRYCLVVGGVAQLISPMPSLGFNTGKEAARLESFSFSGIVNTQSKEWQSQFAMAVHLLALL